MRLWKSTQKQPLTPNANYNHNSPRCATDYIALNADTIQSDTTVNDSKSSFGTLNWLQFKKNVQHDKSHPHLNSANPIPDIIIHELVESSASIGRNPWHQKKIDSIFYQLDSHRKHGLSTEKAANRLHTFGSNSIDTDGNTPIYILFLLQFYNLIIGLLLFASVAAISLQEYTEGIAVLFIVFLNASIATVQEYKAGNALDALAQLTSAQSIVIRDRNQLLMDSKEIVPGDIVELRVGDVVPADLRLVESQSLKVNEMNLTGEPTDVSKKAEDLVKKQVEEVSLSPGNMVFSSTTVTAGSGNGIVVATGMATRVGVIASLLKNTNSSARDQNKICKNPFHKFLARYRPKKTPLERNLHKLGILMGSIAIGVAILLFVVGFLRNTRDPSHPNRPVWLTMVMVAVSVAVSAVPEGLPVVTTLCLTSGTTEMIKENVLVRKLAAVETLGASSVICTDKTGTLTEGKMTAVKIWGDSREYEVTGKGFDPSNGAIFIRENDALVPAETVLLRSILVCCVLCSNTFIKQTESDGNTVWEPIGNSSEAPLIVAAAKHGIDREELLKTYPLVDEIPFNSTRKMMITIHGDIRFEGFENVHLPLNVDMIACVKGAPNYIIGKCSNYCTENGEIVDLNDGKRAEIAEMVDNLSSQALRVLAVAILPLAKLPYDQECETIDEKLSYIPNTCTFMGLIGCIDPERDGVEEAILKARMACVRTIMITGDYLATAIAIARNINLLQSEDEIPTEAIDCSQLRTQDDAYKSREELDTLIVDKVVFARARPEDKLEIVKSLKRQGLIAAMTGDGVNDAPALKEADIGVAMGISGTQVAKGASDMILTDDNFCSIVAAIEKGRNIYANIQKFVLFLLSTNIGEIVIIFVAIAVGMPVPLEPLQILVLNLLSDGMPAVALSLEKGNPDIMQERPRPKSQPLIHGRLWTLVLVNAALIAFGGVVIFTVGMYWNVGQLLVSSSMGEANLCRRWTGHSDGWKVVGNCQNTLPDGSLLFPEAYALPNTFENASAICKGGNFDCMRDGTARAQTMTFIGITFTEVIRAYSVRSFTEKLFVNMFSNRHLVIASALSVALTILMTNTPILMDRIFGFVHIGWFQWIFVVAIAINTTFWGEMVKWAFRRRDRKRAKWQQMERKVEQLYCEMENLRQKIVKEA
uniref:Calciumtransporting ATPase 1 putative n=1 Tax=Albugo laibachii Nc14 TaxID=890382 RepID=F0W8L7_9STRA|nr:calciumtransporting ATPase 1 putative [Albugo laibachii Nc14]|eukprot:CCA17472.1 calciumtransporting ATPase 1 putative [Albugo laibachii Nc14]